ncbi:MAG: DUF6048 family protein [Prevotella sp.]|nr:DUF6048 family protein [Prevotella sp.]
MTHRLSISAFISSIAISALLLLPLSVHAQGGKTAEQKDTVAFFRGFAVSVDLIGLAQKITGSYGQYEGALRINLKDKYFPIVELGLGQTNHTSDISQTTYKTSAPYFKIGADFNVIKNKHDDYRIFAGLRYAFTTFKYDVSNPTITDPVWGGEVSYDYQGVKCSYNWIEIVVGVDAKIYGPFHLGWSLRYRSRLSHNNGDLGKTWYVPGFGKNGNNNISGTFNVAFDI